MKWGGRSHGSYVLVHHKIADYNRWKAAFDSDLTARKRAGEIGFRVFYNAEDAHDIFLLADWESADEARKFMNSNELKERMQQAGVQGAPEIRYLEDVRARFIALPQTDELPRTKVLRIS